MDGEVNIIFMNVIMKQGFKLNNVQSNVPGACVPTKRFKGVSPL